MPHEYDDIDETRVMRIKSAADSGFAIINKEDFDPASHAPFYFPGEEPMVTPADSVSETDDGESKKSKKSKK